MPNRGVFGEGTMKSGSAAKGKEVNRWNRKQEAGEASGISGDLCLSNWELHILYICDDADCAEYSTVRQII